jgi:hypothetical protein
MGWCIVEPEAALGQTSRNPIIRVLSTTRGALILVKRFPVPRILYAIFHTILIAQIQDHLRRIRRKDVNCTAPQGNQQHPADDSLWSTPEVNSLLQTRDKQTAEEKKEARKFQAKKTREHNQLKFDKLKTQFQLEVDAGRMTLDSMEDALLAANHLNGVAKDKYELQILRRRLSVYENAINESHLIQAAQERARRAEDAAVFYENQYLDLSALFSGLFNSGARSGNYLTRFGFKWPTTPSVVSYFLIYAIMVPPGTWPSTGPPIYQQDFEHCASMMRPEELVHSYGTLFGSEEAALHVLEVYNNSKDLIERQQLEASHGDDETRLALFEQHNSDWEAVKAQMLGPRLISSDRFSLLLMARAIEDAAGWIQVSGLAGEV